MSEGMSWLLVWLPIALANEVALNDWAADFMDQLAAITDFPNFEDLLELDALDHR